MTSIPSLRHDARYSGIVDLDTGGVLPEADVASKATAAFDWSWVFASDAYFATVTCRVDHVKTRGVPIPIKLRGRVKVYELKHAASDAAASLAIKDEGKLDHVTCECSSTLYVVCACPDIYVAMAHSHLVSATA